MPRQLNIFIENRPGRLKSVTEILSQGNINIIAFTIQDRGDFGVMKLLVDKPDVAHLALADKGFACVLKDILVVSIQDKPGNLNKLASLLLKHNINIIDTHGFVIEPGNRGICCIESAGAENANITKILEKEGFGVLGDKEISEL